MGNSSIGRSCGLGSSEKEDNPYKLADDSPNPLST
jgi:hypothetical protein